MRQFAPCQANAANNGNVQGLARTGDSGSFMRASPSFESRFCLEGISHAKRLSLIMLALIFFSRMAFSYFFI